MHQSYQEVRLFALWSQVVSNHLLRFWAFSAAALLAILLFYWLYGGVIAFLLVCFGVSGVLYQASRYPKLWLWVIIPFAGRWSSLVSSRAAASLPCVCAHACHLQPTLWQSFHKCKVCSRFPQSAIDPNTGMALSCTCSWFGSPATQRSAHPLSSTSMAMPAILATGETSGLGHQWTNSSSRLQNVKGLYSALGCNVALLEYRGYGRSEGSPSEVCWV